MIEENWKIVNYVQLNFHYLIKNINAKGRYWYNIMIFLDVKEQCVKNVLWQKH